LKSLVKKEYGDGLFCLMFVNRSNFVFFCKFNAFSTKNGHCLRACSALLAMKRRSIREISAPFSSNHTLFFSDSMIVNACFAAASRLGFSGKAWLFKGMEASPKGTSKGVGSRVVRHALSLASAVPDAEPLRTLLLGIAYHESAAQSAAR
jgi:hypothetical protein